MFNTVESKVARLELQFYAQSVVADEWLARREQRSSEVSWSLFNKVLQAVGKLKPTSPRETALMPEIWARANELMKLRRERLDASDGRVPGTLWNMVVLGTLLSLLPTFVLARTSLNRFVVGTLSVSVGLVFFFVAAMDRPFAGTENISSNPFKRSMENMANWDTMLPD